MFKRQKKNMNFENGNYAHTCCAGSAPMPTATQVRGDADRVQDSLQAGQGGLQRPQGSSQRPQGSLQGDQVSMQQSSSLQVPQGSTQGLQEAVSKVPTGLRTRFAEEAERDTVAAEAKPPPGGTPQLFWQLSTHGE